MRAVRIVVVGAVLGLLGLLVWDVAHGSGPGVAQNLNRSVFGSKTPTWPLTSGSQTFPFESVLRRRGP